MPRGGHLVSRIAYRPRRCSCLLPSRVAPVNPVSPRHGNIAARKKAVALDLFCGAGGLTRGLLDAGIDVIAGYDVDRDCKFPYEHNNPGVQFFRRSVRSLTRAELAKQYPPKAVRVLVGCAPCAPFSQYTQGL